MITFKRIGVLLLAVPALLLLAFGPRTRREMPTKDVVIVEYWEKWTGDEGEKLQETVDDFNRTVGKAKGIYVNCLSTSGVNQKTLVATAGGVPPDVAGLWDRDVAQLAAMNALEPLDALAADHGITAATYKKVFWDECQYDNKLYALVSTPYCYALHYNKEIFAQNADRLRAAGLDPTRPPRTIVELDKYAEVLDEKAADGRSIRRTGYLPLEPGWDLGFVAYQFGGSWWDADAKKFTFTDPKVIEAFTWVQSYSHRLGQAAVADYRSAVGTYDSPQNPFMVGTTAMVSQGTFFANTIHNQNKEMDGKWAVAPLPTATEALYGATSCTADVLCIPKGAKHKAEAFEFIAWLNTQGPMEKLCKAHCKISPLAKVSDDFLNHHQNPFIRVFEDLANGPNARGTPSIETLPDVAIELLTFVPDLATIRVTPKEGLETMQQRMQARYDDFMAKQKLYSGK